MSYKTITPQELMALRQSGQEIDLIDVRTPVEFREVHAEGARLVPLHELDPQAVMSERNGNSGRPLYVICKTGNRANQACEELQAAGYDNVVNVKGGTEAWEQAGLPVVRGKKSISLERQVRIAAGSLVLLGSLLALFVNVWFIALAAFVGAGLVFAGLTDTCGMALLLARMPWNQVKADSQSPACRR